MYGEDAFRPQGRAARVSKIECGGHTVAYLCDTKVFYLPRRLFRPQEGFCCKVGQILIAVACRKYTVGKFATVEGKKMGHRFFIPTTLLLSIGNCVRSRSQLCGPVCPSRHARSSTSAPDRDLPLADLMHKLLNL